MPERGLIRNREQGAQIRDYSGLRFGTITPTDIDGFVDFGGQGFVVFELKFIGSEMPWGQRLAIERLVDTLTAAGKVAIGFVATHDTHGDIDAATCLVTEYRWRRQWRQIQTRQTLREAIEGFAIKHRLI